MITPHTCTKRFTDFPFAHRQPAHAGHCRLIHGHNWSFEFEFQTKALDRCGFVVDFGDLKDVRAWLTEKFDHTLVLNEDDPWLDHLKFTLVGIPDSKMPSFAEMVLVPNCGAEGLAEYVFNHVNEMIRWRSLDVVTLLRCTVFEDTFNSATFKP